MTKFPAQKDQLISRLEGIITSGNIKDNLNLYIEYEMKSHSIYKGHTKNDYHRLTEDDVEAVYHRILANYYTSKQ